jgi:uncharacterized protein (DUF433 family)
MSDATLLDAQFAAEVGTAIAQAQASRDGFIRDAQVTIDKAIRLGQMLRGSWETLSPGSQGGVAERARAPRGDFLEQLGHSLELMRSALEQASRAAPLGGAPLRGADALASPLSEPVLIQREALAQLGLSETMAALLTAAAEGPLHLDKQGDIRVGGSRVLLDTIIEHYNAGISPEDIAGGYHTIHPADVYEAIACYLRHKDDVEAYLRRREAEAVALRQQIESAQPSKEDLKAQVKERWSRRKADHAAPAA